MQWKWKTRRKMKKIAIERNGIKSHWNGMIIYCSKANKSVNNEKMERNFYSVDYSDYGNVWLYVVCSTCFAIPSLHTHKNAYRYMCHSFSAPIMITTLKSTQRSNVSEGASVVFYKMKHDFDHEDNCAYLVKLLRRIYAPPSTYKNQNCRSICYTFERCQCVKKNRIKEFVPKMI